MPVIKSLRRLYSNCKGSLRKNFVERGRSSINLLETFPAYVAHGWGSYKARADLTVKSINQTIPAVLSLTTSLGAHSKAIESVEDFRRDSQSNAREQELELLLNQYGSDKARSHRYHLAYCRMLVDPNTVSKIFEIGLGTNNEDVVSTMGRKGKPGASLRSFRDFCPSAQVYGADFDTRVLFSEERIDTFFVDQTEEASFGPVGDKIGNDFDLMIDDGLHAPNANLHSLKFFLGRLRVGGWAVIEDVVAESEDIWKLVSAILPNNFECHHIQCKDAQMFAVCRLS